MSEPGFGSYKFVGASVEGVSGSSTSTIRDLSNVLGHDSIGEFFDRKNTGAQHKMPFRDQVVKLQDKHGSFEALFKIMQVRC